ncbi:MAG: hypothetical protein CM1200mP2_11270 [Planctomycetaceae bacterium]|nr:MAG: hypothetical protein CM1200mP2_11270 [Planctomycetaceae bacterium]
MTTNRLSSPILDRANQQGRPDDADESVVRPRFDVYQWENRPPYSTTIRTTFAAMSTR